MIIINDLNEVLTPKTNTTIGYYDLVMSKMLFSKFVISGFFYQNELITVNEITKKKKHNEKVLNLNYPKSGKLIDLFLN